MKEFATLLIREKLLQQIFVELNNFTDLKPSIDIVLKYIKILTNCSSVGVRLKNEKGAPYYTYNGFSEDFISHEDDICTYGTDGKAIINKHGACILQCMCGAVLNENIDGIISFLTVGGSFWTNNSSQLIEKMTPQEKNKLDLRYHCNACGYESIALIPIKYNGSPIGLLQLNDKAKDKFNEESIYYLEMVGVQLGIAIRNRKMYTELLLKYNELNAMCL